MISMLLFLLAYFFAGAPAIHPFDGWTVFLITVTVLSVCDAITKVGPLVVVQTPIVQVPVETEEER